MTLHTLQIVDSIASSPTVRLDLNDGTTWRCTNFEAPPPRLRRAMSENAMRDGVFVSSSSYSARELALTLVVVSSTQDANATQLQTLARELDRSDNYLKWQPAGATKPVFFKLFRSDFESLLELRGQTAAREGVVRLLAEPFALGLRETLSTITVNNDPIHATNPCYATIGSSAILGDVATPAIIVGGSTASQMMLATTASSLASSPPGFSQCESMTLGTDTTNPGGGPDAAMSGTGTNNYVRTSFGTASMTTRLTWADAVGSGRYRVIAAVRRSDATSVMSVRWSTANETGKTVALALSTSRLVVDLGVVSGVDYMKKVGYSASENTGTAADALDLILAASRTSGAGTLDWDVVMLFPVDTQYLSATPTTAIRPVIDGPQDAIWAWDGVGDPLAGTGSGRSIVFSRSGSLPSLVPGLTNHLYLAYNTSVTGSVVLTVHFWPRYLYVRPATT